MQDKIRSGMGSFPKPALFWRRYSGRSDVFLVLLHVSESWFRLVQLPNNAAMPHGKADHRRTVDDAGLAS